jgi:signal transduction histidine kinase
VNLSELIEEWLDDLGALPDSPDVKIERDFPPELYVAGEKRYTSLIVQNVLENARKYNRPGGRMRVKAESEADEVVLRIGNTGRPIAADAQKYIFERFHRGGTRSSVSGHGLGLNLARELARLHGGGLRLMRSGNDWTEFEVRLRALHLAPAAAAEVA